MNHALTGSSWANRLETDADAAQFDIDDWDYCAVGYAGQIPEFRDDGLCFSGSGYSSIAAEFFGVAKDDIYEITMPSAYDDLRPTPADAAKLIRKLITKLQEGEAHE